MFQVSIWLDLSNKLDQKNEDELFTEVMESLKNWTLNTNRHTELVEISFFTSNASNDMKEIRCRYVGKVGVNTLNQKHHITVE